MTLIELISQTARPLLFVTIACAFHASGFAASFAPAQVFATGAAVGATQPDSVTYGNGSVWVEYGNGASSTNYTGSSTIVQYSLNGAVQNTYTIAGSVDGLKYNPNTGMIWALQNQDASSQLSIINPTTKVVTSYTYGAPYTSFSGSRGFDDVAFIGNNVFLSITNPASTTDAVLVQFNSATPSSPITFSTVLTGAGLLLTDPDSLKSTPTGGLVETGEGDGALTFINNPGQGSQTAKSVKLVGNASAPDDSIYPISTSGTFYIADTAKNVIYALSASGLSTSSLYVDAGNVFGSVDPNTGVVTPIFTAPAGSSLHGVDFVTPEPSSLGISFAGLLFAALWRARQLRGRR